MGPEKRRHLLQKGHVRVVSSVPAQRNVLVGPNKTSNTIFLGKGKTMKSRKHNTMKNASQQNGGHFFSPDKRKGGRAGGPQTMGAVASGCRATSKLEHFRGDGDKTRRLSQRATSQSWTFLEKRPPPGNRSGPICGIPVMPNLRRRTNQGGPSSPMILPFNTGGPDLSNYTNHGAFSGTSTGDMRQYMQRQTLR